MFDILHLIMLIFIVLELIFTFLKIGRERKKKREERKYSQHIMNISQMSLVEINSEIKSVGDLIRLKDSDYNIIAKIKLISENLEITSRKLFLFSSDNPIEISQSLLYFRDRKEKLDRQILEFLKLKMRDKKGDDYNILRDQIDNILQNKSD